MNLNKDEVFTLTTIDKSCDVLLIGPHRSGKTQFIKTLSDPNALTPDHILHDETKEMMFHPLMIRLDEKLINLNVMDSPGWPDVRDDQIDDIYCWKLHRDMKLKVSGLNAILISISKLSLGTIEEAFKIIDQLDLSTSCQIGLLITRSEELTQKDEIKVSEEIHRHHRGIKLGVFFTGSLTITTRKKEDYLSNQTRRMNCLIHELIKTPRQNFYDLSGPLSFRISVINLIKGLDLHTKLISRVHSKLCGLYEQCVERMKDILQTKGHVIEIRDETEEDKEQKQMMQRVLDMKSWIPVNIDSYWVNTYNEGEVIQLRDIIELERRLNKDLEICSSKLSNLDNMINELDSIRRKLMVFQIRAKKDETRHATLMVSINRK